jgi:hypothetical protein
MKITKSEARILRDALNTSIATELTALAGRPFYYTRERDLLALLSKVRRVKRLEKYMSWGGR